jgi:hypothetical protein
MSGLRNAGVLWILAGVVCAGVLIFVFGRENLQNLSVLLQRPALPALMLLGAIVAVAMGSLLIARPGAGAVRLSSVAGIAWLIVFGSLPLRSPQTSDPGPVLSIGLIVGFGVAGAVVAYWSRRGERFA